jgi:hypothetical protein
MLPSSEGRKIRVAHNASTRQWLLAIGPNISRAKLKEQEQAARETLAVAELQQQHDALIDEATALEAQARAMRNEADVIRKHISAEIKKAVGPALPFTETFDFQADEQIDAELAGLPQRELVNRLLSARGTAGEGFREIQRGWWGDMQLMSYQPMIPGPQTGGEGRRGFDGIGSPEWLDQIFPNWNELG